MEENPSQAIGQNASTEQSATTELPDTNGGCNLGCAIGIVVAVAVVAAVVVALLRRRRGAKTDDSAAKAPASDDGKTVEIYVGNLNYATTDEQLRKEFARFGVVKSARVVTHRASGKSKGYGFVLMPHRNEAEIAISKLNNHEVMGRKLRVNEARNGIPGNAKKK